MVNAAVIFYDTGYKLFQPDCWYHAIQYNDIQNNSNKVTLSET
jgi:hypothetical protein